MNAKTAVIYARVSDKKQVETNLSIPAQIEKGKEKAASEGWEVVKVFSDEGISGSGIAGRDGFLAAIEYCEIFNVDNFICWSSSRFSRNRLDAALFKKQLDDNNTSIHYLTMSIDRDTDAGRLMDGFFELMDEHKSIQTSRDTRRSMVRNAQEGYWNGGHVPFGYQLLPAEENPKKKKLIINPDESWIIQKIFELKSSKGSGCRAISNELNQMGLTNRGRRWAKSTVISILRNESFIGQKIFGKTSRSSGQVLPREQWIIVESHDAIISNELWNDVQSKLDRDNLSGDSQVRKPVAHSKQIFAGLLSCEECGSALHLSHSTGRSKSYPYYKCSQLNPNNLHKVKAHNADNIDQILLDVIAVDVLNDINISQLVDEVNESLTSWKADNENQVSGLQKELNDVDKRLSRMYELLETTDKEFLDLGDLGPRLRELKEKKVKINRKIESMIILSSNAKSPKQIDLNDMRDILSDSLLKSGDTQRIREFIKLFVVDVRVSDVCLKLEYKPKNLVSAIRKPVLSQEIWLPDLDLLSTKTLRVNL